LTYRSQKRWFSRKLGLFSGTMQKYKMKGNGGLFDEEMTYNKLSEIGNPLDKISLVVDFEIFRDALEAGVLNRDKKTMQEPSPLTL